VLVSALQQPEDDREGLPHPCPACGQIPEEIIEIEEVVVEVSEGPHP
jgi:hypothetical protein